jgi:two-component system, cell cycle response regulator
MDKLDKPTYLRNKCTQIPDDDFDVAASYSVAKINETQHLKDTLRELIESANHNQETQEKFYDLELYFLESRSYESLISRILQELKLKLRLTQVELYLVDPGSEIRQLIEEIYGKLEYANLIYTENITPIKAIYSGSIGITLTQDPYSLEKVFSHHATVNCSQSNSAALLPLVRANRIIGSLHLGSRDQNRFHSGLASNFLNHLGSIISVCIENSINQERYKHLSLVDILTRAKNRRYFFQVLAKEIARSARSHKPLSCLFIDIDHFKNINDTHGHLVGDNALRQVAKSISPLMRKSDVLARFGGEEFTVLLPDCDIQHANEIAERIREKVAQVSIEDEHKKTFNVTISIGVSNWLAGSSIKGLETADDIQNYLINQADKGVYQAKQDGRNCVRMV